MSKHTKAMHTSNKGGSLYIYGKNPVSEMLKTKATEIIEVVLVDFAQDSHKDKNDFAEIIQGAKRAKIPTRYINKKEAELLVREVNTQRVLARIKPFKYTEFREWKETIQNEEVGPPRGGTTSDDDKLGHQVSKLVLVLDKIEDPQNFGAIVRSAGAAGVSAVFVANVSQAPVTATVFKTSAGVITKVPIVQVANISDTLEKLKDLGFWNYGVDMSESADGDPESVEGESKRIEYDTDSKSMWEQEFDSKTALVVGAEGSGLSRIAREKCDFLVHIPMQNGVESLNVSVAAALSMYEWRRQQS